MSGTKISTLLAESPAAALSDNDGFEITQSSATKGALASQLATYIATKAVSTAVENLAALKALTTRPDVVTVKTGQAAGQWQWVSGSSTTADDALVVNPTSGTAGRYKRIYSGAVDVTWWGASGGASAATNVTAIQAAIDYQAAAGGGGVYIPADSSKYQVNATINEKANVFIFGDGPRATDIEGTGNFAVFTRAGTSLAAIEGGGISNMGIWGPWVPASPGSNTSAYGIKCQYGYRCTYRDIKFFGLYAGHYSEFCYEVELDNLEASGIGSGEQSRYGFLWAECTVANNNNAHKVLDCVAANCYSDGWRLFGFAGTTFIACRGENCDGYGWNIGSPTSGTAPVENGHWVACLGDACDLGNWLITIGSGATCRYLQFDACESGGTPLEGWRFIGATETTLVGCNAIQSGRYGLHAESSSINVTGMVIKEHNYNNSGYAGIILNASTYCTIESCTVYTTVSTGSPVSVIEFGAADNNVISGNITRQGITRVGASTRVNNNIGWVTEAKGTDSIASGGTTKDVTHGLSVTPTAGDVWVNFTEQGTNDYGRVWLSNFGSTTFRVNVSADPGASNLDFSWGARVL
jgi:hypothetical protein